MSVIGPVGDEMIFQETNKVPFNPPSPTYESPPTPDRLAPRRALCDVTQFAPAGSPHFITHIHLAKLSRSSHLHRRAQLSGTGKRDGDEEALSWSGDSSRCRCKPRQAGP